MVDRGRRGFTLAEALVALTISSILVILVSTVFLVQNRYFAAQVSRSSVQDVARASTELLSRDIRSTMAGGVRVARSDSLTLRSPMVVAAVCANSGADAYVQFEAGEEGLDQDEVAGVGAQDPVSGDWAFYSGSWSGLDGGTTDAADRCETNGADTVGARDEFRRIVGLGGLFGSMPLPGTLLTFFRETTFAVRTSQLDPRVSGLFVGSYGDTLTEFATGLASTAGFRYRRSGQSTYQGVVTGAQLDEIHMIRIIADARKPAPAPDQADIVYGWSVNVPLGNAR